MATPDECTEDLCKRFATDSEATLAQTIIFFTTTITCLALLYDLAQRYVFVNEYTTPSDARLSPVSVHSADGIKKDVSPAAFSHPEPEEATKITPMAMAFAEPPPEPAPVAKLPKTVSFSGLDELEGVDKPGEKESNEKAPSLLAAEKTEKRSEPEGAYELLENLLSAFRETVDLDANDEKDLPESCRKILPTIAAMKYPCNTTASEFDRCSLNVVKALQDCDKEEAENEKSPEPTPKVAIEEFQKSQVAIRSAWNGIRRLLFCSDVHLRNAAAYQKFHYDTSDLQRQLAEYRRLLPIDEEFYIEKPDDLEKLVQDGQEKQLLLKLYEAKVNEASERSKQIVPVPARVEPITEPHVVKALCSFKTQAIKVAEGDHLTLLNNDNTEEWKVQTVAGEEEVVPSVCILIPPPDSEALKAASRLRQALDEAYALTNTLMTKRMLKCTGDIFDFLLLNSHLFKNITEEHKAELLSIINNMNEFFDKFFHQAPEYQTLKESLQKIRELVEAASTDGEEDPAFYESVLEALRKLLRMMNNYEKFADDYERYKASRCVGKEDSPAGSDWDTLEDATDQEAHKDSLGLAVKVRKESTSFGQASSLTSSTGEVRQRFSVCGVIDPRDKTEISMKEAIRRGIIDQTNGIYKNPVTGEEYPIPVAMNAGLILVESSETRQLREQHKAVGFVTVTVTRETKPYTIRKVLDPRTDTTITVEEAIEAGIFNKETGTYKNIKTGHEMTIDHAIDCGALVVDYDEASSAPPEVVARTFAVHSVMDRAENKRLAFYEASERGIIDKEEGMFLDTLTRERMHVVEALRKGYVRARIVESTDKMDVSEFTRGRSLSLSSDGPSDGSK